MKNIPTVPTPNPAFDGYKLALPPIVPKECRYGSVYRPDDAFMRYCAWPSVCSDEKGNVYAVSSSFRIAHVGPVGKIAMHISGNGGNTWSPPIVVADGYTDCKNGGILYLGNGKMLLNWCTPPADIYYTVLYNRMAGDPVSRAFLDALPNLPIDRITGGSFVSLSEDYGMTWSRPEQVPVESCHGAAQCADGTIILFGKEYFADREESLRAIKEAFDAPEKTKMTFSSWAEYIAKLAESRYAECTAGCPVVCCASTDGGRTWEKRGTPPVPRGKDWFCIHEPAAIELPDGTLLGVARAEEQAEYENDFTILITRSRDGGYTWTDWECSHMAGSPPQLVRHSSGALICSVGRRVGDPLGAYAYVSYDDGRTWEKEYQLMTTGDSDCGYTATTELPDGSLLTVYYFHYTGPDGKKDSYPSIGYTHWKL